jgi:hypothetical protein
MLANFEEAQKGYEEQIALLKDSLERSTSIPYTYFLIFQ